MNSKWKIIKKKKKQIDNEKQLWVKKKLQRKYENQFLLSMPKLNFYILIYLIVDVKEEKITISKKSSRQSYTVYNIYSIHPIQRREKRL